MVFWIPEGLLISQRSKDSSKGQMALIIKQAHIQVQVPIHGEMACWKSALRDCFSNSGISSTEHVNGCLNGWPYLYMYITTTNTQRETGLKKITDLKVIVKTNQRTSEDWEDQRVNTLSPLITKWRPEVEMLSMGVLKKHAGSVEVVKNSRKV